MKVKTNEGYILYASVKLFKIPLSFREINFKLVLCFITI